jgi:hypothetical protein
MVRFTARERLTLAGSLLTWLKGIGMETWPNNSKMLEEASDALEVEKYDLWKAFDLLIILGRLERNNPNGRFGGHVANWTPVEQPLPPSVEVCRPETCPVVKALRDKFPECMGEKYGLSELPR